MEGGEEEKVEDNVKRNDSAGGSKQLVKRGEIEREKEGGGRRR